MCDRARGSPDWAFDLCEHDSLLLPYRPGLIVVVVVTVLLRVLVSWGGVDAAVLYGTAVVAARCTSRSQYECGESH